VEGFRVACAIEEKYFKSCVDIRVLTLLFLDKQVAPKQPNEWLIVMGHFPVYSFRGNGPTRELEWLRKWMNTHHVDAYFSGHDHALQHIAGGQAGDPEFFVS
jgi:hypothetical protein